MRMVKNHNLVDLEAKIVHETDGAYLLLVDGKKAWVPKVCCEDNNDGTFTMEEAVAIEKGFV